MPSKEAVIITGSSGFIGSALINKLAGRYALIGFDRIASRSPPPAAECVCIDLTSEPAIKAAFERVRIAYGSRIASVIHLAAYYDLSGEPSPLYEQITVRGTERLLEELKAFEVEQFVFTSTMLVHAPTEPGKRINEDSPLDPRWPYPLSKVETEALIREKHGNIPIAITRLAGVYDDRSHAAFLSQQIARIYERQLVSHLYPGDIRRGQAFVHLDDVTDAFARLIEKRHELPKDLTLLIGEPDTLSYDEVQQTAGQLVHSEKWETREIPKSLARTGAWIQDTVLEEEPFVKPWMVDFTDDHYALDIARARKLLGWKPKHSLRDTLPKIVDALKADPPSWYRANKLNAALVAGDIAPKAEKAKAQEGADQATQIAAEHREMREHERMMLADHRGGLWAHFANIALGAWLLTAPVAFGLFDQTAFSEAVLRVTAERGLPSPEWRNMVTAWSDIISGVLLMGFGALSLSPRTAWAQWGATAVGLWLLFAPLFFWTPSAAAYMNDTIVGTIAIAFSVLVPMMPGMSHEGMMDESDVPPGWTYSPSSWLQRIPIIALGLFGFVIARYLTAYQMGHADHVWEPFFSGANGKNGTEYIITSDVSRAWPIPDAGLGAASYMLEVLMGAMGTSSRWRTMPWMVTFFFILVVPLGGVSIFFIVIQPIMIGTYCTLCLIAAFAMLVMIPLALDEVVAMGQYMVRSDRAGRPLFRTFFQGGPDPAGQRDRRPGFGAPLRTQFQAMAWGVTVPWQLAASCVVGAWLMFSPAIFGTQGALADSDHLVGAMIITIAVIAMAEVARPLRFLNVPFGLWLVAALWLLQGATIEAGLSGVVSGLLVVGLNLPRGRRSKEHYAGWDRVVV